MKLSRALFPVRAARICLAAIALAGTPSGGGARPAVRVLGPRLPPDPADPDKPADVRGTADVAASDIATAIKFCKNSANSSRRAMYQLGRAYAANREMP